MKRAFLAGLLSAAMTVSMMAGTVSAAGMTADVSAQETVMQEAEQAEGRSWDFTASSSVERPTLERAEGEFDGIKINALEGKFSPRENDTQINAGTTLSVPVSANENGATLSITLSGGSSEVEVDGVRYASTGTGISIPLAAAEEDGYCTINFIAQAYISAIAISYNEPAEEYPGVPESAAAEDKTWTFETADGLNDESGNAAAGSKLEGNRGTFDGMKIDATSGKFNIQPEQTRVVINAGTVLYIPAAYDAEGASLLIAPGTYTEHVTVDKPWVSFQPMYRDGGEIVIEESYYSSNTFDADGNFIPQDEYDVGTDKSGTVLLTSNATGFSASGITFKNSYNIDDHTAKDEQTPAVAFGSAADKVYLKDCRFIGRQDTLYLHGAGSRVQVEDCYIEGTVDFIFGDADAYFTNCDLYMAYFTGKDNGYFTAANTKKGNVGFVFSQCNLEADPAYGEDGDVSLGRPWQTEIYTETGRNADGSSYLISYDPERKNPTYENTSSAVTFIECTMDSSIQDERWNVWTRKDKDGNTVDVTYHDDVRFAEYNSKDETGAYLDPSDYTDIVLGTMAATEDAEGLLDSLLAQMGFGDGVGEWTPGFTDFSGEKPAVPDPGTDDNNNNGGAGGNGSDENGGTTGGKNAAAKTGDTWNTAVWTSAVLLAAGALLSLMRKKVRR